MNVARRETSEGPPRRTPGARPEPVPFRRAFLTDDGGDDLHLRSGGLQIYRRHPRSPHDLERTNPEFIAISDSSPVRSPPLRFVDVSMERQPMIAAIDGAGPCPVSARNPCRHRRGTGHKSPCGFEISWSPPVRPPYLVRERKRNPRRSAIRTRFVRDSFRLPGDCQDRAGRRRLAASRFRKIALSPRPCARGLAVPSEAARTPPGSIVCRPETPLALPPPRRCPSCRRRSGRGR